MKYIFSTIVLFVCLLISSLSVYATHNRAGEITYRQIGNPNEYKFEIKLTTYTEINSTANRNEID